MVSEQHNRLSLSAISPAAAKPLYEQIVEGIKREVSAGRLAPHTPLPSFRVLAEDMLVSVITVKRAYEELEREGIIYRKQGLGTFVSETGMAKSREVKQDRAEALLRQALREGLEAGVTQSQLLATAKRILSEETAGQKYKEKES